MNNQERINNIIAYVGMIDINDIKGMSEDDIRKMIIADAAMMDAEQATFTLENIDEIIDEITQL